MNKVILMGRLTRNPEIKYSASVDPLAVTKFTLAVNRPFTQAPNQTADFIPCTAFGKRAETIANYVRKGQMITIVGRLQLQTHQNESGDNRTYTDVIIDDFYFAESKRDGQAPITPTPPVNPGDIDSFLQMEEDDEDLPF